MQIHKFNCVKKDLKKRGTEKLQMKEGNWETADP